MDNNLKKKATSGLLWSLMEKLMTQGFSFAIGIIMARLLNPDDYGYVVIAMTVISVAEALVEGGLSNALIQRKDTDEDHCNTMFYFMVGLSFVFYGIMFAIAPFVAAFYKFDILTKVIRVSAITLPIGAVRTFYMAMMQKELQFRKLFIACLPGTLLAGTIGIVMVLNNFEIWSLVAYLVLNKLIDTIMMIVVFRWRPKLRFSFAKLKELYSFAGYALAWQLVNQYTNQIIELFIGKKYSAAELSYYNRGKQYPFLMCNIINNAIGTTLFPVLSKMGDNREQLKNATRRSIKIVSFIQLPMLFGFAMVADPLVRLLLTEKWISCVPFLQITCVTYSFWPFLTCYSNAIDACGQVKQKFIKEIVITVLKVVICGIALFISPMAVAIAYLVMWILDSIATGYFTGKTIGYKLSERLGDVTLNYICSGIMAGCVWISGRLIDSIILKLLIQIIVGMGSYVIVCMITRNENMKYLLEMILMKIKKTDA